MELKKLKIFGAYVCETPRWAHQETNNDFILFLIGRESATEPTEGEEENGAHIRFVAVPHINTNSTAGWEKLISSRGKELAAGNEVPFMQRGNQRWLPPRTGVFGKLWDLV